ncbi:MAG: metallophosphoesterase [Kouleothrix sp.]|nr:metallophosphoesterase [Kouleothrix sp.]
MRILITADLHYRPAQRAAYVAFAEWVREQQPDCFIIAGDIGHPLRLFQRGLQLFHELTCPRALIAGNHDVYRGEHGSRALWQEWLPQITRDEGFVWLEDQPLTLAGVGICGTLGWYDYSSRAPHLPLSDGDYRSLKAQVNHDADYIDWPWSDQAMARYLARRFSARLGQLADDPAVRQIVVVTHMPIFEPAIPRHPESMFYSLLSAYLGNFTLGQIVRGQPKVTHVVSGHLHRQRLWAEPGPHGPIECQVVPSRPGAPAAVLLELG